MARLFLRSRIRSELVAGAGEGLTGIFIDWTDQRQATSLRRVTATLYRHIRRYGFKSDKAEDGVEAWRCQQTAGPSTAALAVELREFFSSLKSRSPEVSQEFAIPGILPIGWDLWIASRLFSLRLQLLLLLRSLLSPQLWLRLWLRELPASRLLWICRHRVAAM